MTRSEFEEKLFGVLKWISIVFFTIISLFPLVYMLAFSAILSGESWRSSRRSKIASRSRVGAG